MSDKKKGAEPKTYKFDTLSLHAGYQPHKNAGSRQVPIYQTTSYLFDDVDHAAALFNLERGGHIYSRISNPTVAVLEERVAALEGGTAALATSSGMSAIFLTIMTLCQAGDHLVVSSQLYGGTVNLFRLTLPKFGIKCTFVKPRDTEGFKKAIQDNTKGIFGELVGNPGNELMNMPEIAKIAHEAGIPLMVDATYQTPYLCKPIEHGADIVVHSLTKWIGGHGNSIGGIVFDGGNFDWTKFPDRQPLYNEPEPSYWDWVLGKVVPEVLGANITFAVRARFVLLRDLGSALSPANAFNIIQGLETLPLRVRQSQENAEKVASHLANKKGVARVIHPSHQEGIYKERAGKYLEEGNGSLVGFELEGGLEAGKEFIDKLKLFYHVANIGDSRSLAIHPASTTHSQLSADDQVRAGVTPGYVRLSVGIEHIDDIIADLDQALA